MPDYTYHLLKCQRTGRYYIRRQWEETRWRKNILREEYIWKRTIRYPGPVTAQDDIVHYAGWLTEPIGYSGEEKIMGIWDLYVKEVRDKLEREKGPDFVVLKELKIE